MREFIYLGSLVSDSYSLGAAEDAARRVSEASKIFGRLKPIWKSRLTRSVKKRLFTVCVVTALLFGAENSVWPSSAVRTVHNFYYRCIRSILRLSWQRVRQERITNERCAQMLGVPDWKVIVGKRHARWLGHVARMSTDSMARQCLYGYSRGRTTRQRGLRKTLINRGVQVLRGLPTDLRVWAHSAQDKSAWNAICDKWSAKPAAIEVDEKVCPVCGAEFGTEGGCNRHITKSHPVRCEDFRCEFCTETFRTKIARTKHLEAVHDVGAVRDHHCPHGCGCGPFKTIHTLRQHCRRKHSDNI